MKAIEIKSLKDYDTLAEQLNQVAEIVFDVVKTVNPNVDKVNLILRPMFSNPLVHVVVEVQPIFITTDCEGEVAHLGKIAWKGSGPTVEDALQDLIDSGQRQLLRVQQLEREFEELTQRIENARTLIYQEKEMFLAAY